MTTEIETKTATYTRGRDAIYNAKKFAQTASDDVLIVGIEAEQVGDRWQAIINVDNFAGELPDEAYGDLFTKTRIVFAEKPAPVEEAPKVQKPRRKTIENGGIKDNAYLAETSTAIKPTKLVHEIASSMPEASRKDVIAACRARGIAYGTARTQYQAWFKANKK